MFKSFKERWEAEESKLGKFLKYYIGYIGIACGLISENSTEILAIFGQVGISVPHSVSMFFLYSGVIAYVIGKLTKKPNVDKS